MNKKLLVDEMQLKKALMLLNMNCKGEVLLQDVMGVINNCNIWVVDIDGSDVAPILTRSVRRRLECQLED